MPPGSHNAQVSGQAPRHCRGLLTRSTLQAVDDKLSVARKMLPTTTVTANEAPLSPHRRHSPRDTAGAASRNLFATPKAAIAIPSARCSSTHAEAAALRGHRERTPCLVRRLPGRAPAARTP